MLLNVKPKKDSLNFTAKIADFALCRPVIKEDEHFTEGMGSFHWMAPELFEGEAPTTKTDVYSFAVC